MTSSAFEAIGTVYITVFWCIGKSYGFVLLATLFLLSIPTWLRIQGHILYFGFAAVVGRCLAGRDEADIHKFLIRPLTACLVAVVVPLALLFVVVLVVTIVITFYSVLIVLVIIGFVAVVMALLWVVVTFNLVQAFYWWDLSYLPMGMGLYLLYTLLLWSPLWIPFCGGWLRSAKGSYEASICLIAKRKERDKKLRSCPTKKGKVSAPELLDEIDYRPPLVKENLFADFQAKRATQSFWAYIYAVASGDHRLN